MTAAMLEARLALVERLRRVEHGFARAEQARAAAALVRGRSHTLGNAIQIVKLASLELEQRLAGTSAPPVVGPDTLELVRDLRGAADQATGVLDELFAAAQPEERTVAGAAVVPVVRAAVDLARPALAAPIALAVELDEAARTLATGDELEALVIASLLDAAAAVELALVVRARTIEGKPWIELIRMDDRAAPPDDDALSPGGALHVVHAIAELCRGEVTLAPGRRGLELAVALPQSSSS